MIDQHSVPEPLGLTRISPQVLQWVVLCGIPYRVQASSPHLRTGFFLSQRAGLKDHRSTTALLLPSLLVALLRLFKTIKLSRFLQIARFHSRFLLLRLSLPGFSRAPRPHCDFPNVTTPKPQFKSSSLWKPLVFSGKPHQGRIKTGVLRSATSRNKRQSLPCASISASIPVSLRHSGTVFAGQTTYSVGAE
jgi:hypothetical protein